MNVKLLKKVVNSYNDKKLEKFINFINLVGFFEGINNKSYFSDDKIIEEAKKFADSNYELVNDYLKTHD